MTDRLRIIDHPVFLFTISVCVFLIGHWVWLQASYTVRAHLLNQERHYHETANVLTSQLLLLTFLAEQPNDPQAIQKALDTFDTNLTTITIKTSLGISNDDKEKVVNESKKWLAATTASRTLNQADLVALQHEYRKAHQRISGCVGSVSKVAWCQFTDLRLGFDR